MKFSIFVVAAVIGSTQAAPKADLVTTNLPDFPDHRDKFNVYSGFLNVSTPTLKEETGYSSLVIHYQFDTSSSPTAANDPVAAWHTGGPGGSSLYGLYGELGYFQIASEGQIANDDFSFNQIANMLYLESPAGAFLTPTTVGMSSGFSYCLIDGIRQDACSWDDTSQAAAYTATLTEFYKQFPEYASNDLLFIGESYAGQYLPNIANYILTSPNTDPALKARLKGMAVGNGCWGGGENSFMCNGPNENRDDVALLHGKGLISSKMNNDIQETCDFAKNSVDFDSPDSAPRPSAECELLLQSMDKAVGPYNIYNLYDNCPTDSAASQKRSWHEASGKSDNYIKRFLVNNGHRLNEAHAELTELGAGFDWTCGAFDAIPAYFARSDVREALHLPAESLTSAFSYSTSGPASVTLYPSLLASGLQVLIYNGDADACVPYIGNEIWTTGMEERGYVEEVDAWHPWAVDEGDSVPTGSATSYKVVGSDESSGKNFQFVTIRLAGHEVPNFTPRAGFGLFSKFLSGEIF